MRQDFETRLALGQQMNTIAAALGISREALNQIVSDAQGDRDPRYQPCAFTTNRGTACTAVSNRPPDSAYGIWACGKHEGMMADAVIQYLRHDIYPVNMADAATAIWERAEAKRKDGWTMDSDLIRYIDRLIEDRLAATWGAA